MAVVKSVEKVTLCLTLTSSTAVNLSLGQDETNCVPFYTFRETTAVSGVRQILTDVFFDDNLGTARINAKRTQSTGALKVIANVVEFDPVEVNVQQGAFSFTGTTTTLTISAVTLDKTFALCNGRNTQGAGNFNTFLLGCDLVSTTGLQVRRNNTFAAMTGHYFVVEDTGTNFTTQKIAVSPGTATTTQSFTLSAVTLANTFLVGSVAPAQVSDDMEDAVNRVWLESTTRVNAERVSPVVNDAYYWAVSTGNGSWSVQQAQPTAGVSENTDDTAITSVDTTKSVVINSMNDSFPAGINSSTTASHWGAQLCSLDLTSATNVRFERSNSPTSLTAAYAFQVVEFELTGGDATGLPIGTLQMMGIGR